MVLSLRTKILLTVITIVLMFGFFTLFYFPAQQGNLLLKNYNNEVQNLANTVALGVKIAITEQNFEGVQTAMEFVKDDARLKFVSLVQFDTVWNKDRTKYEIKHTVFNTFPESEHPSASITSADSIIVKKSHFSTSVMTGEVLLAFTTKGIKTSKRKIRNTSLMVSGGVFVVGLLIAFWLARNISSPVKALRTAAMRVSEGDYSHRVKALSNDEIGELGIAFNKMTDDLSRSRQQLNETNFSLSTANKALNDTLMELQSTQAQLIHSEKMASLGELTAGIAHEIENPLNFVNNFSEISIELLNELQQTKFNILSTEDKEEAENLIYALVQNLQKIAHHGKRADNIVKGMLQHSQSRTGKKEITDINKLADEYLRLSYHGLRAKDPSFNATLKTDFDESLEKINIIPQDIGRVLLNLFTNAFYAVNEKKKRQNYYEPIVSVITKRSNNKFEIKVIDNGNGIPEKVLDKIFQPFFTTKPAGQGTGLGLSLSYDIIKAHGGELKVQTKEGEGSEFIIDLPAE
ncbi:MAG TPA: ATP-binding protein [Chitinophagaceae bacterium]|nr:ATP-binding protein [Chitinophagaceae bacterium]